MNKREKGKKYLPSGRQRRATASQGVSVVPGCSEQERGNGGRDIGKKIVPPESPAPTHGDL